MNGLQSAHDVLSDMIFQTFPVLIGSMIALFFVVRVVGPIVEDIISDRRKTRDKRREREANAEHRGAMAASEIAVRGEFDDWLEAETLRLQIECVATPEDQSRADALAAVEAAKTENAARIIALHQQDDTTPVKSGGPEAVKQQWEALRAKSAGPQTRAA